MSAARQKPRPAPLRQALAGAAGGFLVFLLLEPGYLAGRLRGNYLFGGADDLFWPGIVFGGLVTAVLILADEWANGSVGRMLRRAAAGALMGMVLGAGYSVIAHAAFAVLWPSGNFGDFYPQVVARCVSWACFGLGVGLSAGLASRSQRRAYHGCAGGLLGGCLGGFLFGLFNLAVPSGMLSRLAGFVILAACVGLATALVEELTKLAWLTFLSGSREGQQVVLHEDGIALGRSEHAEVPLFGDPLVEAHHAVISLAPVPLISEISGRPLLRVNGQPTREAALLDGALIQIGRHRFRFHHRYLPSTPPAPALGAEAGVSPWTALPTAAPAPAAPPAGPEFAAQGTVGAGEDFWPGETDAGPSRLLLRVTTGPLAGVVVPLTAQAVTLGREQGNDLTLADPRLSRFHARIELLQDAWVLTDLGSKNGTKLNGLPITRAGLQPGDFLYLGETVIAVEGS